MAYDSWTDLLADPNIQQWMGSAGQKLQSGEGFAAALNPADTIRKMQFQKAVGGWPTGKTPGVDDPTKKASMFDFLMNPTPKGMEGPDGVTINKTADGLTFTSKIPSPENLSTYGTTVPPEAIPAQPTTSVGGGVSDPRPFWDQLLGMEYPMGQIR